MADEQSTEQQGEQPQDGARQPEEGQQGNDQGAGSKDALKADLASERDKRQALEAQVAELTKFREGLTKLIGGDEGEVTPEQLKDKLTAAETASTEKDKLLAVYQSAPQGVDVQALLDSRAFVATLNKTDGSTEAISKAVDEFVKANPRFSGATPAGTRDTSAGNDSQSSRSVDDWLRGNL